MKHFLPWLVRRAFLPAALLLCPALFAAPTKVACVGDSITYGYTIHARNTNSYPAQLQRRLDEEAPGQWEVKNFGVSAMTLVKSTSRPYMGRPEYRAALKYRPDVVLIMLGTNDSNPTFRNFIPQHFNEDYKELIDSFRQVHPQKTPRIILMLPPTCYLYGGHPFDVCEHTICKEVRPRILRMARQEQLEIIDLQHALGTEWNATLMPDKLHPSAAGAARMVERIAPVLTGNK